MRAGFFAGLIAGEGSFTIREQNGGQSRCCGFSLNMRADDMELVQGMRDFLQGGRIYARAAQGRAKPQVCWQVTRAEECARLAEILHGSPLLNKKAGDFELWSEAVSVWRAGAPGRWERMDGLARALSAHRETAVVSAPSMVDISPSYLDDFLAGFATAEAHFGVKLPAGAPTFVLKLRADDRAVLDFLASHVGAGRVVTRSGAGRTQPVAVWTVTGCDGLQTLAAVLDRSPPAGRQGRVYTAWRELLDEASEQRRGHVSPTERLRRRELAWFVRTQRAYTRPAPLPATDDEAPRRERCLAALREWAAHSPPAYTAGQYEKWRSGRRGSPHRNTIARTLGSWRAGLEAAGLPTSDCHSSERANAIGAAGASRRAGARVETRRRILEAVDRCALELGRLPRALEFLQWRLEKAPDSPSQMTVYRAFPAGWAEVLKAAAQVRA